MSYRKEVARRISEQMGYAHKNQVQVARELGVDHSVVYQYTTGRSLPNYEKLRKLCKILDCTYEDILGSIE